MAQSSDIYKMCGIAGIIQANPSLYHKEQLENMTRALSHRGPEGQGHWQSPGGHALLGHCRLCIIDLSPAAAQPMHSLEKYSIVHNGEIYNYIELREELRKNGYSFRTQSDTEVILASFDYWGEDCVLHFDGMFAFAIWDEEEKELFAARDRFGEKPFYYFFEDERFLFGSEMKAIWAAGISRQPNLRLLFNFITIGYVDNPARPEETFYTNISKLPPASRLFYAPGDQEPLVEKYWDLDPEIKKQKVSEQEAIEIFNNLLNTSVKRRLRSDVAVGTSLSGGLDSSSIVAIASGMTNKESFASFTASFPGFQKDETPYARKVADKFGLRSHQADISLEGLLKDWDKLCYHQEEPFGSASIYAQYRVYELAQDKQVKVLLDGQGADETLAGYNKYYKWYWQELFIKRRLVRSGELKASRALGIDEKFGVKNIIASLFPDLASVILERQYLLKALGQEDLTRDFIKQHSKEAYYIVPEYFNLNGALYFNTIVHGLEELLRYADRNSMAFGRETRLPFLNHELVEFIFSLPSQFKIRSGWTKWILRTVMNNRLPDEITWRKDKIGFEPPQQLWMQSPAMQDMVRQAREKLIGEGILRTEVRDKPVRARASHEMDNYDWRYLAAAPFI